MTSEQILNAENQTESVALASKLEYLVESSILGAVAGEVLNPQEGVDYASKSPQEIVLSQASAWVKNAVLLGVMAGMELALRQPHAAPDVKTLKNTAAAIVIGCNAYSDVQSIAREG